MFRSWFGDHGYAEEKLSFVSLCGNVGERVSAQPDVKIVNILVTEILENCESLRKFEIFFIFRKYTVNFRDVQIFANFGGSLFFFLTILVFFLTFSPFSVSII